MHFDWLTWFQKIVDVFAKTPTTAGSVSILDQTGTTSGAAINQQPLSAGQYRVNYYAQIVQAASVSSSLTPSFSTVYNGVAQTFPQSAITGNTTTTHQQLSFPVQVDASSDIAYSFSYASSGATPMKFSATVILEQLP